MNEKVFEKATEYIDVVAAKLGVAAEHVYELMVRQQIAEGVADTIIGIVCLTTFITLLWFVIGAHIKPEYTKDSEGFRTVVLPANIYAIIYDKIEDSDGMFYFPYIIIQLPLLIFGIAGLYTGILGLINPEYYAIKEILDAISGD